jgi:Ca2+-binding RTX toxin-like protein
MGGNPSARGEPERGFGGPGNDKLYGNRGYDELYGDSSGGPETGGVGGDDRIRGGRSGDLLWGGPGQDRVIGGSGNDTLAGGPGKDVILGGPGPDEWEGFAFDNGADRVLLGTGRDLASVSNDGASDLIDCGPGLDSVQQIGTDPLDEYVRCEFIE